MEKKYKKTVSIKDAIKQHKKALKKVRQSIENKKIIKESFISLN